MWGKDRRLKAECINENDDVMTNELIRNLTLNKRTNEIPNKQVLR